eukprot:RCo051040
MTSDGRVAHLMALLGMVQQAFPLLPKGTSLLFRMGRYDSQGCLHTTVEEAVVRHALSVLHDSPHMGSLYPDLRCGGFNSAASATPHHAHSQRELRVGRDFLLPLPHLGFQPLLCLPNNPSAVSSEAEPRESEVRTFHHVWSFRQRFWAYEVAVCPGERAALCGRPFVRGELSVRITDLAEALRAPEQAVVECLLGRLSELGVVLNASPEGRLGDAGSRKRRLESAVHASKKQNVAGF